MYCFQTDITFQEVPNEVSLVLSISGCPHKCKGCHSIDLWKDGNGDLLTLTNFTQLLNKYERFVTCICFFGGEWEEENLISFLELATRRGLKTCLYTGAKDITQTLKQYLNYLKLGPWIEAQGGLNNHNTNQVFIDLDSGETLNHLFQTNTRRK